MPADIASASGQLGPAPEGSGSMKTKSVANHAEHI